MLREQQIPADFTIPNQNKCYINSVFSFANLFPACSQKGVSADFHFSSKDGFTDYFFQRKGYILVFWEGIFRKLKKKNKQTTWDLLLILFCIGLTFM